MGEAHLKTSIRDMVGVGFLECCSGAGKESEAVNGLCLASLWRRGEEFSFY